MSHLQVEGPRKSPSRKDD